MTAFRRWPLRYAFWKAMPAKSRALFLTGVFFTFAPAGLLTDISNLGGNGPGRLCANAVFAGAIATAYVTATRHARWLPVVVMIHLLVTIEFDRLLGPLGPPLDSFALRRRLLVDVDVAIVAIVLGFSLLSNVVRQEGTRFARIGAEIALAKDIHRLLVPPIRRCIPGFEVRGVSIPSGEVGGDLVDFVETSAGWATFVVDVSGHGVGAGLMMGMVKSAARTDLRHELGIDRLLDTLNTVMFSLKGPAMFATFAGLQSDDPGFLRFAVAGHLPILHYHAATGTVEELTTPQVPIAMLEDRSFTSSRVSYQRSDVFVILSDGLTEVFDSHDREFGLDRVSTLIQSVATEPLEIIEQRLLSAVRLHGDQLDDQTLLLVRAVR